MSFSVNWVDFGRAAALVAVFEGLLPFLNPEAARRSMRRLAELGGPQLRIMGFVMMLVGCLILWSLRA
jgi:uncharacterized protein YjeT (DUF2065 family)